jgi:hypothetical protein
MYDFWVRFSLLTRSISLFYNAKTAAAHGQKENPATKALLLISSS